MGCRHSKCHTNTTPVSKEPTHDDVITTCHADITVAMVTETADANSHKHLTPKQQVANFVESALESYLPDYTFCHTLTKGHNTMGEMGEMRLPNSDKKRFVMEVARDPKISLAPDQTGTKLSYGLLRTKYTLYVGTKSDKFIKFVYQWKAKDGKTYVTSPYSLPSTESGVTVPCATVDITNALGPKHAHDPVAAIKLDLGKLNSVNSSTPGNHNLNGPDFEWVYEGPFGVDMSIYSNYPRRLYWEDVSGDSGEVKLIDKVGMGVKVKLKDL